MRSALPICPGFTPTITSTCRRCVPSSPASTAIAASVPAARRASPPRRRTVSIPAHHSGLACRRSSSTCTSPPLPFHRLRRRNLGQRRPGDRLSAPRPADDGGVRGDHQRRRHRQHPGPRTGAAGHRRRTAGAGGARQPGGRLRRDLRAGRRQDPRLCRGMPGGSGCCCPPRRSATSSPTRGQQRWW